MAIVLFTDFGSSDLYVGQVEAVLERYAPGVRIIHLLHDAPAFNVKASAHLLAALAQRIARGHVFMGVVDPGVDVDVLMIDDRRGTGPQVLDHSDHGRQVRRITVEMHGTGPDAVAQPVEQRLVVGETAEDFGVFDAEAFVEAVIAPPRSTGESA